MYDVARRAAEQIEVIYHPTEAQPATGIAANQSAQIADAFARKSRAVFHTYSRKMM